MKRRDFVATLGGAVAEPMLASAGLRAQPAMPVIGFLHSGSPGPNADRVAVVRKGLGAAGLIEGQNVAIEFRWASGESARLPEMAADLVRRQVSVIDTPSDTSAALAAKAATSTIPVVFAVGGDPVHIGLVASLNRPGGNVTGVHFLAAALGAKRLGLLHELRPEAARFALLVNPNNPVSAETMIKDVTAAAATIGRQIEIITAGSYREIDTAFVTLAQKRADGLLVMPDPMFLTRRVQLATLATRHALPAIFPLREFVEAVA